MGNTKDKKTSIDNTKRKSVKKIVTGASVVAGSAYLAPKAWKKPVVDSIILPAHAQTTVTTTPQATTTPTDSTTPQATTTPRPTTTPTDTTTTGEPTTTANPTPAPV